MSRTNSSAGEQSTARNVGLKPVQEKVMAAQGQVRSCHIQPTYRIGALPHVTVSFGLVAGVVVSVQTVTIAWDIVNIPVTLMHEHHYPVMQRTRKGRHMNKTYYREFQLRTLWQYLCQTTRVAHELCSEPHKPVQQANNRCDVMERCHHVNSVLIQTLLYSGSTLAESRAQRV